jgi:hypothetical protein
LSGTIVLLCRINVSFTGDVKVAGSSGTDVVEKASRRLAAENKGLPVMTCVVSRDVKARSRNTIVHVFRA